MKRATKITLIITTILTAVFITAISASAHSFTDVSEYSEAIDKLSESGIILGYNEYTFAPNDPVTRWQMALLISKLLTAQVETAVWQNPDTKVPFTDIHPYSHYPAAIDYAHKNGIIVGRTAEIFAPSDGITLRDGVTMCIRALGYPRSEYDPGYPDSYMSKGGELGLLRGLYELEHTAALTRGQTAQLLYNTFNADSYGGSTLYKLFSEKTTADDYPKPAMIGRVCFVREVGVVPESGLSYGRKYPCLILNSDETTNYVVNSINGEKLSNYSFDKERFDQYDVVLYTEIDRMNVYDKNDNVVEAPVVDIEVITYNPTHKFRNQELYMTVDMSGGKYDLVISDRNGFRNTVIPLDKNSVIYTVWHEGNFGYLSNPLTHIYDSESDMDDLNRYGSSLEVNSNFYVHDYIGHNGETVTDVVVFRHVRDDTLTEVYVPDSPGLVGGYVSIENSKPPETEAPKPSVPVVYDTFYFSPVEFYGFEAAVYISESSVSAMANANMISSFDMRTGQNYNAGKPFNAVLPSAGFYKTKDGNISEYTPIDGCHINKTGKYAIYVNPGKYDITGNESQYTIKAGDFKGKFIGSETVFCNLNSKGTKIDGTYVSGNAKFSGVLKQLKDEKMDIAAVFIYGEFDENGEYITGKLCVFY